MKRLTEARKIIDRVDAEMAKLFAERMKAVAAVAETKRNWACRSWIPPERQRCSAATRNGSKRRS